MESKPRPSTSSASKTNDTSSPQEPPRLMTGKEVALALRREKGNPKRHRARFKGSVEDRWRLLADHAAGKQWPKVPEDESLRISLAPVEARQNLEIGIRHAEAFANTGYVLDAWDALAHCLLAKQLPSPAVCDYFIRAAEGLRELEDDVEGGMVKSHREAQRRVLASLIMSTLVKGSRAQLKRDSFERWRNERIRSSFRNWTQAEGKPPTAAYDEVAAEESVSRSAVVQVIRAEPAERAAWLFEHMTRVRGMPAAVARDEIRHDAKLRMSAPVRNRRPPKKPVVAEETSALQKRASGNTTTKTKTAR